MARIDSVGRMRLPPDSGIRTQAHSEREHATSEPVKRALTEWFQAVRQGQQSSTDEVLTGALRNILTDRVQRGDPLPRFLPLQVLAQLDPGRDGNLRYQVQLGQSLVELTSRVPLQPGQTLLVSASERGPTVMVPQTPAQYRLIESMAQRQQLTLLPALQRQLVLTPLNTLLQASGPAPMPARLSPDTALGATPAPTNPVAGNPTSAPIGTSPGSAPSGASVPAASWMAQLLTIAVQHWRDALPTAPAAPSARQATGTGPTTAAGATNPPAATPGTTNSPVAAPAQSAEATAARPEPTRPGADAGRRLALSQHWIPQLIATAKQTHGEATASTVRQVWQQWQQAAAERLQTTPMPDLSRINLAPATRPAQPLPPMTPNAPQVTVQATDPVRSDARPAGAAAPSAAAAPGAGPEVGSPGTPPIDPTRLVPMLRTLTPAVSAAADRMPPGRTEPAPVPADIWRLIAEQVLDQRLQQLGQSSHPTLQEQLQRRAEQLRSQQTMTYSPDQLRQQLGQRPGGEAGSAQQTAMQQEQQSLLQLRQTLEQVSQQQLVRTLQSILPDNPVDPPRVLQGIPLLSDQQLLWFELERHAEEKKSADKEDGHTQTWILDLHFQLPPLAPVCARLRWSQGQAELTFLTDDTPTLRAFHNHLDALKQRLDELSLPVGELQCRYGLPPRRGAGNPADTASSSQGKSHQIDVRT